MEKNNFDSIQEQVDSAIRASFVAGTDEQASNGEAGHQEGRHRIHTNSRLNDLLTLSRKAFPYIKSQHNDILCIKDVTVGHINDFLESKAGGCTPSTLRIYAAMLIKIAHCVNHFYNQKLDWETGLVVPKGRMTSSDVRHQAQAVGNEEFKLIMTQLKGVGSKAAIAIELTARFGLRASETAEIRVADIRLDNSGKWGFGQISISEKGGSRVIDIVSDDDRAFVRNAVEGKNPEGLLVGIKQKAVERQLYRAMKSAGIMDRFPSSAMHGIRKLCAQKCWDEFRNEGYSVKEAAALVSKQLGLGFPPDMHLLGRYVANMW